jgi:hypothetical protein
VVGFFNRQDVEIYSRGADRDALDEVKKNSPALQTVTIECSVHLSEMDEIEELRDWGIGGLNL